MHDKDNKEIDNMYSTDFIKCLIRKRKFFEKLFFFLKCIPLGVVHTWEALCGSHFTVSHMNKCASCPWKSCHHGSVSSKNHILFFTRHPLSCLLIHNEAGDGRSDFHFIAIHFCKFHSVFPCSAAPHTAHRSKLHTVATVPICSHYSCKTAVTQHLDLS